MPTPDPIALQNQISAYLSSGFPQLKLSKVHPDYIDILTQLMAHKDAVADPTSGLSINAVVWKDFFASATGQVLLELLAGVTAFNQFHIESAFRESFTHTALRDSSIYAITRMLGVVVSRKIPAAIRIKLINTGAARVVIGRNSLFVVGGKRFFNRDEWILDPSTTYTTDKYVFEGEVRSKVLATSVTVPGDIYLGEPGFIVSNYTGDITLSVKDSLGNVALWSQAESSLYTYSDSARIYYLNTSGDGDVVFTFGDGVNGALPGNDAEVRVTYIVTSGSQANVSSSTLVSSGSGASPIASGLTITAVGFDTVQIKQDDSSTLSGIYGGADEKPASYYKLYAPYLFRAKQRAVTKTDYVSIIMGMGDIASVVVEAQRDLNPSRVDFMNVVQICALPNDANTDFFDSAWEASTTRYMERYIHACIRLTYSRPIVQTMSVKASIYVKPTYNVNDATALVTANLVAFFKKGPNSLGRNIYLSDLLSVCLVEGVDHCAIEERSGSSWVPFADKIPPDKKIFYRLLGDPDVKGAYTDRSIQSVDSYL
jgi:hypothetical protein